MSPSKSAATAATAKNTKRTATPAVSGAARAVVRMAKQVEVALAPLDLSISQFRVMALLGEGSSASSELARRLAVSPPSVTSVVDGLVGRALVERRPDPDDRRRLTLLLTPEGIELLGQADAAAQARLDEIAAYFDEPPAPSLDAWNVALDRNREARMEGKA
jgi:DNA-binding MarR family transcriptional regulator